MGWWAVHTETKSAADVAPGFAMGFAIAFAFCFLRGHALSSGESRRNATVHIHIPIYHISYIIYRI